MTYSFRIRFNRSPTDTIQSDAVELSVPVPEDGAYVVLRNTTPEQPIKNAKELALCGSGFTTESEALETGQRHQLALMVALARARVGVDFGLRATKGFWTECGLSWLEDQVGQRILNNIHGLMVYRSEPRPRFAQFSAKGVRGTNAEKFQALLLEAIARRPMPSERELLAFTLFNASFFQPTADSRFLLLVMAIESLIELSPRSTEACNHIQNLIAQTKAAEIPKFERDSIIGSLQWLLTESISQAGKRLVSHRLGDRVYENRSANAFFAYCYQMRSNLVHGKLPYPTFEEVSRVCGALEVFVSDLLTSPFLGMPT